MMDNDISHAVEARLTAIEERLDALDGGVQPVEEEVVEEDEEPAPTTRRGGRRKKVEEEPVVVEEVVEY